MLPVDHIGQNAHLSLVSLAFWRKWQNWNPLRYRWGCGMLSTAVTCPAPWSLVSYEGEIKYAMHNSPFLALKFRSSREMRQEWSVTRVAEHEWPLVARMPGHEWPGGQGMPKHEWPGRQDALNCRHPVLCVSDRDPRWNLDPGPARNPSRVTSPVQ